MASKLTPKVITSLILPSFLLIFFYSRLLPLYTTPSPQSPTSKIPLLPPPPCNLFKGRWILDPSRKPMYDSTCPFHRNAWNCIKNQRENMGRINSWKWVPESCDLNRVDPDGFLNLMRNKNIGFVGDSLNENFLVSFLCTLRVADAGAKKWKRKGAWRGAYFPKFNVTVGYHRAVLLAKYEWQTKQPELAGKNGVKGIYRVDIDIPADDWANVADFYSVLVFNTGHWWGYDKFPKETPLVFFKGGRPIYPPLEMSDGLKVVVQNMVAHVEKVFPKKVLKFWRLQSPRHFYGGEWNQNGSCLFDQPLEEVQLDSWFDPSNNGVNKEARKLNHLIEETLKGTSIRTLDLTHLSEFRADAHPAIWLGKKDAVAVWGQDCMHWCLPGVPDTWVDILTQLISYNLEMD
ncbi:UNVERIFIED_CONTAM: protein trichome birefringence-like 12 [Sesamum angustifolium]|uniref:Protein trichome birefringence-like 12 n=1 Tax=Sesamum angustifolium TaxID=2727405 RepID=A0AAW2QD58_9LAMI